MASEQHGDGDLTSRHPECIDQVKQKIRVLRDALKEPDLPDLPATPSTTEEVMDAIRTVCRWAGKVRLAYGFESQEPVLHTGLRGLFGPRLTSAQERTRTPRLTWARDVLGPVPEELSDSYSRRILHMDPDDHRHMLSLRTGGMLRYTPETWPEIRECLETGIRKLTADALKLADWADERVAVFLGVQIPARPSVAVARIVKSEKGVVVVVSRHSDEETIRGDSLARMFIVVASLSKDVPGNAYVAWVDIRREFLHLLDWEGHAVTEATLQKYGRTIRQRLRERGVPGWEQDKQRGARWNGELIGAV